jgi:alcohol dehydrogenase (NADP+)
MLRDADGDARNPDSKPFSVDAFMATWRQCERLVDMGLVKYIGMSSMTIPKLDAVLPLCRIKPAAIEMELHPSFQQQELFDYILKRDIQPIAFAPSVADATRPRQNDQRQCGHPECEL